MKHICSVCAYVYDDEIEGVPFDELPDDWVCPICTADKSFFEVDRAETAAGPVSGTDTDTDDGIGIGIG